MKLTYLNVAQQAVSAEREEDYLKAVHLWNKAKGLARNEQDYEWADYRSEHNSKRSTLLSRAIEYKEKEKERRKKYKENPKLKKEAELLEANINKISEMSCE
ncbi:ANR family transcriptional regulator [Providencia stuartii]|uniref:ANR family transcriptional regulator n=2 Tax=Enterobacterales TaxID=91347 RepID=UPI0023B0674F|nr:ANR family transcriptional regulator [Providencia thailandensis]MDE8747561.1 ANR family transcriptional regulator [Providencia thailandensis]MDE8766567.1 ANR family transcriptional regulator [Providencia thailandensis]MDE8778618.1 ANR family transcriptional regulator [Providencia thailandensis]MDE8783032.1 ANR family transcriptional regulator [Providencia thailandensis]MDE8787026.1 ANR family transcriptional regulator [Providencia thailandensis]